MAKRKPRGKSPRDFMLADLKRSGLTAADATKMKCHSGRTDDGECFYQIPYFDPSGSDREFFRERLEYDDPKYLQPEGEPPQLYFPPLLKGGWKRVLEKPVDLWITEGEKKAAAATKLGIPCVGIGGVRNWTRKESGKLIADFDLAIWENRSVHICFDSDFDTNHAIRSAFYDFAEKLQERNARVFRVVLPNILDGKPGKVGLDDFIAHHRRKALAAVTKLPAVAIIDRSGYVPLDQYYNAARDFDSLTIPDREVLIPGVLDGRSLTMIYGPTGIGKSWLALELCRALATGADYIAWPVNRKCRSLLIDGEMPMQLLQQRLRLLNANKLSYFGILPSEPLYLAGCPLNIHELAHQERIMHLLDHLDGKKQRPDVLVFDNLSSLARGYDENSNTDLDGLLEFFVALRHIGYSVVVVHHAGKSGRQRGASRREDFMDTIIKLSQNDEVSSDTSFTLSFEKTRGARPEPAELTVSLVSRGKELKVAHRVTQLRRWKQWELILRVIRDDEPRTKADIARHLKVRPQSLSRPIKEARGKGYMSMGNPPVLTPKGRAYLARLEEQAEVKFE